MNPDTFKKATQLHDWIMDQEVVKEFQKYEKIISSHPEFKIMEEELKELQKQIVIKKHHGDDVSDLIVSYQKKKQDFDENPILYNYKVLKEEVNDLLNQIQGTIREELTKRVD